MKNMNIVGIKANIAKTTKELRIKDLKPSIISFSGSTGVVELSFSSVWQTLQEDEKHHLLNYFLHNLENEFGDYIKNVIEWDEK